eukprot:scaffold114408_cov33-Tisochrysis_lutea.AAC.1
MPTKVLGYSYGPMGRCTVGERSCPREFYSTNGVRSVRVPQEPKAHLPFEWSIVPRAAPAQE